LESYRRRGHSMPQISAARAATRSSSAESRDPLLQSEHSQSRPLTPRQLQTLGSMAVAVEEMKRSMTRIETTQTKLLQLASQRIQQELMETERSSMNDGACCTLF